MSTYVYPLGHDATELDRLDEQAKLLADPLLDKLAAGAKSCLEIGCGNGSNLPLLRRANPSVTYTGIDIEPQAIAAAKKSYSNDAHTQFLVMGGSSIDRVGENFDLIFTKLVLWSIGPNWIDTLHEAYRLLAPGGSFYALEPCNQFIELQPEKRSTKAWMQAWDKAASQNGLDSYIGTKVAGAMHEVGFSNIGTKFHPVIALGHDQTKYKSIIANLIGFYMGPAADTFGLSHNKILKDQAVAELDSFKSSDLVMDALFVTWGAKRT